MTDQQNKEFDPDDAWLRSEGYDLPDETEVRLTFDAWQLFYDKFGPNFRKPDAHIEPGNIEYIGHLEDAQIVIWLCKLRSMDDGAKMLRRAAIMLQQDRWEFVEAAQEWWNMWFLENEWRSHGAQHYQAIMAAQQMIGDILGSQSNAVSESEGDSEDTLGKQSA